MRLGSNRLLSGTLDELCYRTFEETERGRMGAGRCVLGEAKGAVGGVGGGHADDVGVEDGAGESAG